MENIDSNDDGSKDEKRASRGLDGYVARRIANMSPADWKNTPSESRTEFVKAARRAIAAISKYAEVNTRRQEKQLGRDAKRQERREARLKARKAKASKAEDAG
jgi:hypothetical protein